MPVKLNIEIRYFCWISKTKNYENFKMKALEFVNKKSMEFIIQTFQCLQTHTYTNTFVQKQKLKTSLKFCSNAEIHD